MWISEEAGQSLSIVAYHWFSVYILVESTLCGLFFVVYITLERHRSCLLIIPYVSLNFGVISINYLHFCKNAASTCYLYLILHILHAVC